MGNVVAKGELFAPEVVTDIFSKVRGKSSIAKLANQIPVAFSGNDVFTCSLDNEVNIVAENGAKTNGGATANTVQIVPIKVEYGARVSDEFLYASDEKKLQMLQEFNDGYAKKIARAIDIMGFHGVNPRTQLASTAIGTNSLDTNTDVNEETYDATNVYGNLEDAVEALGDYDATGIVMDKTFAKLLSTKTIGQTAPFAEFALGGNPGAVMGIPADVNSTVAFKVKANAQATAAAVAHAYVGDFQNAYKWGYAKDMTFEVIPYGDPDNTGADLKGHNQVFLRAEAYIGWGILDPKAFAAVKVGE